MALGKDFSEFIALLNENNVRYLVVGGYAVAFHGHPRYTKDLDVWVEVDPENASRIVSSLQQFGFGSLGLTVQDFLAEDSFAQLGYPPHRIDILTGCDGVDFAECYAVKSVINIDGLEIDFINLENLVKNKTAAGRPQDLADVSNLKPF